MFQAKLFSHLSASKRGAALLHTHLCKITVFEVFNIPLVAVAPWRAFYVILRILT
jgi:hypothetical protein